MIWKVVQSHGIFITLISYYGWKQFHVDCSQIIISIFIKNIAYKSNSLWALHINLTGINSVNSQDVF